MSALQLDVRSTTSVISMRLYTGSGRGIAPPQTSALPHIFSLQQLGLRGVKPAVQAYLCPLKYAKMHFRPGFAQTPL